LSGVIQVQEELLDLAFFNDERNCERREPVILAKFFSELTEEEKLYGWF
jgi:hypothetical protein